MSWAARRRLVILIIVGAVVVAFLVILSISTFYQAPSCSDGIENEGEAGIDCGGPCAYLCSAEELMPTVLFATTVANGQGRTDAVAEVENRNPAAGAKDVAYTISFYGADQVLINKISGVIDLPPGGSVPIFAPGATVGGQTVVNAFLTIDPNSFQWVSMPSDPRIVPTASAPSLGGSSNAPVVASILTNPSVTPLANVHAIVFVHDSQGNIIAASATVIPSIPAQGRANATFSWNAPFSGIPALIEVIPVIPLP